MATLERELKRLLDFGHLEKPIQAHLKNVYATLSLCLLVASFGAYVHLFTDIMQAGFLSAIGALAMILLLVMTPHQPENQMKRLCFLGGFAFLTGLGLGPIMDTVMFIDPSIIATAFLGTAAIFICFSLSALYNRDRKFLFLGGILLSGLSWLLMLGLANIFFRSTMIFQIELYAGFLIMCGFVLYDTQLIIEKRRHGDDDFIWHCVNLFIDFVNIFRRLMIILASRESDKKKRRD